MLNQIMNDFFKVVASGVQLRSIFLCISSKMLLTSDKEQH